MKHELKIWPQYYCHVVDGTKTFEVRKNDRGFQNGDEVELHEYDPEAIVEIHKYTGRKMSFRVGYVLPVDNGFVVFSLLPLEKSSV